MNTSEIEFKRITEEHSLPFNSPPELIIGIGNCGRADDGLGWAFLDRIGKVCSNCRIEYRYQLNIEDAELISNYSTVLFVDASVSPDVSDYRFSEVIPKAGKTFTSHALEPGVVLYLSEHLYDHRPGTYLLEIKGVEWGLREGLSGDAGLHLQSAVNSFDKILSSII